MAGNRSGVRRARWRAPKFGLAAAIAVAVAGWGCGGANAGAHANSPAGLTAEQIDADPLALLPASAIVVASVDARAFYTSGSVGAQFSALSEQMVPLGDEAGFKASRDVDRVILGAYSTEGVDVAAVVVGRFDEEKIKDAAESHAQTRSGGAIVQSQYAGRSVYTVANVGFSILTPKTALAGTETGIRRALDRIHDGQTTRDQPAWVLQAIGTPNAAAVLTADFTQPIASAALGSVSIPWANGMKVVRVVADFKPPGMHVAGTLTYADAPSAAAGASGIQQLGTLANLVALTGLAPRLQDLAVSTADANVQCAFSLDDSSMRGLLALVPRLAH